MFRRVSNPPSRFDPTTVDYDMELPPPDARLEVFEDASRSVLTRNTSPDVGFDWSVNPYRGCQHGCAYCYARSSHEYLDFGAGTDFETKILVKPEAPRLLAEAFDRRSWKGEWVLLSGNVDCYQPLEARWQLTRGCLEVCLRYRNPCGVITRSALIARDRDLLAELHREVGLSVVISIPFHDPEHARIIEPLAPTPATRYRTIATLTEAGVPVQVNVAPVIPGLTDHDVPQILQHAREAGARWAMMMPVRLPGPVLQVFTERLRQGLPLHADKVLRRIRELRGGRMNDPRFGHRMRGRGERWQVTRQLFETWRRRLGYDLAPRVRRTGTFRRPSAQPGLFDAR